jgi:hypothetical protein
MLAEALTGRGGAGQRNVVRTLRGVGITDLLCLFPGPGREALAPENGMIAAGSCRRWLPLQIEHAHFRPAVSAGGHTGARRRR